AGLAMDESLLDVDQVEYLIKFCPSKEEMELLQNYAGDKERLGKCEQLTELKSSLHTVNSACDEIRTSSKLKEIMKMILYMGNALNQGTARGAIRRSLFEVSFALGSMVLTFYNAAKSFITDVDVLKPLARIGYHPL
ncbi:formin-like protein 20, partial [Tanacetum coccineum]